MSEQPVVILGMYRSGTSSVSAALAALGVYFGEEGDLFSADSSNQEGYWEHKKVTALHRRLLMSLNLPSYDLDRIQEDWLDRPMIKPILSDMEDLLRASFSGRPLWGLKDPQASTMVPFVQEVFGRLGMRPHYVVCVRHPLAVAASQRKRVGVPELHTIGTWLANTICALHDLRNESKTIILFDAFVEDPRAALQGFATSVGLVDVPAEQWSAVRACVKRNLVHNRMGDTDFDAVPDIVEELYGLCAQVASKPEAVESAAYNQKIELLYNEWTTLREMFHSPSLPGGDIRLTWKSSKGGENTRVNYQPTRSWQTVRVPLTSGLGQQIAVQFYGLPAVIWVKNCFWDLGSSDLTAELLPGTSGNLTLEEGMYRIWLLHGNDHAKVRAPHHSGPLELVLEILVETNSIITGLTFKALGNALER